MAIQSNQANTLQKLIQLSPPDLFGHWQYYPALLQFMKRPVHSIKSMTCFVSKTHYLHKNKLLKK